MKATVKKTVLWTVFRAVSYTHLDVYKRQGLDSPRLLTDGWIMAGIISIMPLSISLGAVSVSYTHLDVYKRQPLKRACLPIPAHSLILSFCIEIVSSRYHHTTLN